MLLLEPVSISVKSAESVFKKRIRIILIILMLLLEPVSISVKSAESVFKKINTDLSDLTDASP